MNNKIIKTSERKKLLQEAPLVLKSEEALIIYYFLFCYYLSSHWYLQNISSIEIMIYYFDKLCRQQHSLIYTGFKFKNSVLTCFYNSIQMSNRPQLIYYVQVFTVISPVNFIIIDYC